MFAVDVVNRTCVAIVSFDVSYVSSVQIGGVEYAFGVNVSGGGYSSHFIVFFDASINMPRGRRKFATIVNNKCVSNMLFGRDTKNLLIDVI